MLCIYPSKCTHTVNTHPEQWAAFMLRHPGSSWGFSALLKGTSVVLLKVERALDIHSPHLQSLPDRDSNSQPFDYESDSTIWPRLPCIYIYIFFFFVCETHILYRFITHRVKYFKPLFLEILMIMDTDVLQIMKTQNSVSQKI